MSSTEATLATVGNALASIQSFIANQDTINRNTEQRLNTMDQRFDTVDQRFDSMDQRFTGIDSSLERLLSFFESQSSQQPSGNGHNHPSGIPDAQSPCQVSTAADNQPKPTWAAIASKPPAPLTDRKRQALHRAFNPPKDSSQNGSYTFVYISRSRRMNRAQIRSKFREISIDNLRVLDLNFPARNTIGVLLHEAYLPEFQSKLLEIDSHLIQGFDPLDHHHIADPKYQDLSDERRTQLAKSLHQDRCIRSLYFIRAHLLPGVAKYFIRQGWVPPQVAQDIINQRLPRPTKRRPTPQATVRQPTQASTSSSFPAQASLTVPSDSQVPPKPTLQDWFGNVVSTQDMDTTPDFASNASGSESSCPDSPISDAVDISQ